MKAYRTWKRDGSTNQMGLRQAALNLTSRACEKAVRTADPDALADRLLAGEVFETPLAWFAQAPVDPECPVLTTGATGAVV